MAELASEDVEVGPNEVLVERRIVPARRGFISPLGVIIVLAFIATCGYVFFGGNIRAAERSTRNFGANSGDDPVIARC